MPWIPILIVAIGGVFAWFLNERWLQNMSAKGRLYFTCCGAVCMAGLLILGTPENPAQFGSLMAILFALAIILRKRDLHKVQPLDTETRTE